MLDGRGRDPAAGLPRRRSGTPAGIDRRARGHRIPCAAVEVRVLGPLEVVTAGSLVPLAPKERVVVSRLALSAGTTVTDDAIRDALWPAGHPPSAAKTMAGYVHRLRHALGHEIIARRSTGYVLDLARVSIDVIELDATVARARTARVSGDLDTARTAYRTAAALFRGRPFDEIDDAEDAMVERARLAELRNCIVEELHDVLLELGGGAELVPELEALVAREPTRERAWGQLMTAYARAGRRAHALEAYSRARRILGTELGIEPSPLLQTLHRKLLADDHELLADDVLLGDRDADRRDRVSAHRGEGAEASRRVRLVPSLDRLIGRDADVARITDGLAVRRLVTLVGPPGVGKTRLAQHVADTDADAHVVDLAPAMADDVAGAFLRGVGAVAQPGRPAIDVLASTLGAQEALVVVDNCEHVLGPVADVVGALLAACPGVRVLATSRERLRVGGELVVDIEPLPTPEADAEIGASPAVELFLDRAAAAGVLVDLDDRVEQTAVVDICRRLDGLPLALELAAAQLRARSLTDLRDDLRVLDLGVGRRDLPARQQSLEALIASSEALLTSSARAALRRLAVFPAGFDAAAAAAVAAGPPVDAGTEIGALIELVEASLVMVVRRVGQANRYRLLETVRRHAQRRLDAAGERGEAMGALLDWAIDVVAVLEPQVRTPSQDAAMAVALREQLTFTAACDHALAVGDERRALRLAATVPMGLPAERRKLISELLDGARDLPADLRARAWMTLANLASDVGDGDRQAAAATQALAAAAEAQDDFQAAWARYFLVLGRWAAGDVEGLMATVEEAIAGFEAIGSAHGVASMHWIAGQLEEDPAAAGRVADLAIDEFRSLQIASGLAHALEGRALIALRVDDHAVARGCLADALSIFGGAGNGGCSAHCVESIAAFAASRQRLADATRLLHAAAALRDEHGYGMRVWEREGHRRVVAALGGEPEPTAMPADLSVATAVEWALAVLDGAAD
jgi:predicted ATPase/DNA-binding SARP family transcriptional activator